VSSAYAALGAIQVRRGHWQEAEDLFRKALSLEPDNPDTLHSYSSMLSAVGRLNEALALRVQLRTIEPFAPLYNIITADVMRIAGQNGAAIAILQTIPPETANYNRNATLAAIYAQQGQYGKAADTVLNIHTQVARETVERAAQILRGAPTKVEDSKDLPAINNELNFVYAHVGALQRVMEYPERAARLGNASEIRQLWDATYAPLRKTDRFKRLVREAGMVEYWRVRGWPDRCRPMGPDFMCD